MASTISRKRPRVTAPRREPRVGDLPLNEFREMMSDLIDARLAEWVDPDAGLELRPEVMERLLRQEREYAEGKRGIPLAEIAKRYGVE